MASLVDAVTFDVFDFDASKAQASQGRVSDILTQSAQENIALQEAQLEEIERLTAPFREAATGQALPALSALAFGGDVDFQPSQLFQQQLERGREGILRQQVARGGLKTSGTFERLADLVSGLAAEDVGRFEQRQLGLLQTGLGSEEALRQAGTSLTGNIAGIQSQLGQGLNLTAQQLGQAQAAGLQSLGSGFSGLADLALTLGLAPRQTTTQVGSQALPVQGATANLGPGFRLIG